MENRVTDIGMASRPKQYNGEYIGTVKTVSVDPKRGLRVQVEIDPIFTGVPTESLPYVTYKLPIGCRANDGVFMPLQVGDKVWCDFPFNGDTRRPRVTGSVHEFPDDKPLVPDDAWAGTGKVEEDATYHEDFVWKQNNVISKVRKDGRVLIQQIGTGTTIYIETDGTISISVCKAQGDSGEKVEKSFLIEVADPDGVLCFRAKEIRTYADRAIGGAYDDCPKELRASTKKE